MKKKTCLPGSSCYCTCGNDIFSDLRGMAVGLPLCPREHARRTRTRHTAHAYTRACGACAGGRTRRARDNISVIHCYYYFTDVCGGVPVSYYVVMFSALCFPVCLIDSCLLFLCSILLYACLVYYVFNRAAQAGGTAKHSANAFYR